MTSRIYMDNAATSWPKRTTAVQAAMQFLTDCGATAGRGSYGSARRADEWLAQARRLLAGLIGATSSHCIAMGSSGTHVLNAALLGLLQNGDHVISTQAEHNSVLRPLQMLKQSRGIQVDFVPCDEVGWVDVQRASKCLRPNTRWIVVGHASNVTGAVQDLSAWSMMAKQCGARLIVDASQTLGYLPIDVQEMGIDVLATAGHKGLQALPGTGLLYLCSDLHPQLEPLMTGGTGVLSELIDGGCDWPMSVEVGNLNLPGVISMAVAASELQSEWSQGKTDNWRIAVQRLRSGLHSMPGVRVLGQPALSAQQTSTDWIGVVSVLVDGWDVHELAIVLDSAYGIEARSGLHCAALIHDALGSRQSGGTLRLSPGHHTTIQEVDLVLTALAEIVGA
jgi:cysteine desulfurase/selenocysteine lyase